MTDSEAFTLVTSSNHKIYDDYEEVGSAHYADLDTTLQKAFREQYPELSLTVTLAVWPLSSCNATAYADVLRLTFPSSNLRLGAMPPQILTSKMRLSRDSDTSIPGILAAASLIGCWKGAHLQNISTSGVMNTSSCISYRSATVRYSTSSRSQGRESQQHPEMESRIILLLQLGSGRSRMRNISTSTMDTGQ